MVQTEKYHIELTQSQLPPFLADTWWFGLTRRINTTYFHNLVKTRLEQGFTAVQIVVGIPPEVGIANPNASSENGFAWNEKGEINQQYLQLAKERITFLTQNGITPIIYGAWGHQIEWIGTQAMKSWWEALIKAFNDLDVVYCLTGESNLWIGEENKLLPNKSTDYLVYPSISHIIPHRLLSPARLVRNKFRALTHVKKLKRRKEKWSSVLEFISQKTNKPIILHTVPSETSHEAINNSHQLAALTVQTGHDYSTRHLLWKQPQKIFTQNPKSTYINLEPWYEGIRDSFYTTDQLYSYWVSMMCGARAYCYGAHGIWNAGDGTFLSHWGKQTQTEAINSQTPALLGKSHKYFLEFNGLQLNNIQIESERDQLLKIVKSDNKGKEIIYYPESSSQSNIETGKYFTPTTGEFVQNIPPFGPLVIFR